MTTVASKNAREQDAPAKNAREKDAREQGARGQDAEEKNAREKYAPERADVPPNQPRRAEVNSGNPRITVAFPFSKIDIGEPSEALRDLAQLVEQLAEHVALIAGQVGSDQADASDRLVAQAAILARRLRNAP